MSSSMSSRLGGRGSTTWRLGAADRIRHPLRPPRRSRRPSSRTVAGLAAGVVVMAVTASALWWAPFLRVKDVDVEGVTGTHATRILRAAAIAQSQPLVEVDTGDVAGRIRSTGLVAGVHVIRRWPSRVAITVSPRVAVLAVPDPSRSGSEVELVDVDGVAFDRVPAAQAPVPVAQLAHSGNAAELRAASRTMTALPPEQRNRLTSLNIAPSGIISLTIGDVEVVWGDAEQGALKAQALQALLNRPNVGRVDVSAPLTPALHDRAVAGRYVQSQPEPSRRGRP